MVHSDNPTLSIQSVCAGSVYFNALLYPYRSLGKRGFFYLMVAVGLVFLVISGIFFTMGAWPIVGFAGLDILALYWAFRANYSQANCYEQVTITHDSVTLVKTDRKGQQTHFVFNPYWVRLETQHKEDQGMTSLWLFSHGKGVEVGDFLHAPDRESLAKALADAIARTKQASEQQSGG